MTGLLIESGVGGLRPSSLFNPLLSANEICNGAIIRLTLVANNEKPIEPRVNICSPIVLLPRLCNSQYYAFARLWK